MKRIPRTRVCLRSNNKDCCVLSYARSFVVPQRIESSVHCVVAYGLAVLMFIRRHFTCFHPRCSSSNRASADKNEDWWGLRVCVLHFNRDYRRVTSPMTTSEPDRRLPASRFYGFHPYHNQKQTKSGVMESPRKIPHFLSNRSFSTFLAYVHASLRSLLTVSI